MGESIAEVAAIAAKLTKAQREFLVERPYNYFFVEGYKPGDKLVKLGILDRQRIGLGDRVVITMHGIAVRNHLEATDHAR
ncbi:MAG: hypothetical protein PGN16_03990 [Sphingomonas phyllosphaerae]|uniref:hypothetical protein n=1 Tax=Sphingomonas phyllosphaerae TaxID=257003 RepID=UPI002FF55C6F